MSSSSQIDNACGLADDADRIERLLEVCVLDILVADPNLLEDRLIDKPSLLRARPQIEVVDVSAEKRQDERERILKLVVPKAETTDDGGRVDAFPLYARRLFAEQLRGDLVAVVLLHQLAFLGFEIRQQSTATLKLLRADLGHTGELSLDSNSNALGVLVRDGEGAVVALDGCLYAIDALSTLRALVALVGRTNEVLIGAATPLVARVGEATAAACAVEAALQVVVVLAVTLAGELVGGEDGLHLVEQRLADDRVVTAGIVLAPVLDLAHVIAVREQSVDLRLAEGFGDVARCRATAQATGF